MADDKNLFDGTQEYTNKFTLSKLDHDLYREEEDVLNPVYRVKRINMPNKGCKWKITLNDKLLFVIEGLKLSKNEKDFLDTANGFNFMLNQAKNGIKSFNNFRIELRKLIPAPRKGRPRKK